MVNHFFLHDEWLNSHKLHLYTDAAGSLSFGAIFGTHWCFGQWPSKWQGRNIAFLEFYPIVLSLYLWGEEMHNNCILFFTDNDALVHVINKQSCKDKLLMFCVRKFVAICLKHNILFRLVHLVPPRCIWRLLWLSPLLGQSFNKFVTFLKILCFGKLSF